MTIAATNHGEPEANGPARLGGGYAVERILGRGSLGPVFLARGPVNGQPVVLKLLADDLSADEVRRTRFLRAAELGMRLSHPNVVRVFEAGVDRGHAYVVMEHVEGETLADRLARLPGFTAADTMTLATHLAAGLAHAHASGVVHGALNARSILLGCDGVARISDFGFARVLGGSARAATSDDVYGLAAVLAELGADGLPPGLTAIVDAGLAHASVRPSAFDVFHRVLTVTSPAGAWLASAVTTPDAAAPAADR
jgi:serine/threonine-protein kinase